MAMVSQDGLTKALQRIEGTFAVVEERNSIRNAASSQAMRTDFTSEMAEVCVGALGRRQAELDRQIELNEMKEAEDLAVQWKFLREQTGAMAAEMSRFQQDTRVALAEAGRAMTGVDRIRQENEELKAEVRGLRAFVHESVESRFKQTKHDLEAEEKKRMQGDADMGLKIVAFEELLDSRNREYRAMEMEMNRVNRQVATQEFLNLKELLDQEVEARRASVDSALNQIHNLQNGVLKEHREQMITVQEKILCGQTGLVEQIRGEIQAKYDFQNGKLATLNKVVVPCLEEMPTLKKRVQEFECIVACLKQEHQKVLERVLADRSMVEKTLERRMQEMMLVQKEDEGAMSRMREVFDEQLTTIKSKLVATFNEQMDVARVSRQGLFQQLLEQIARETEVREEQALRQAEQWNGHRMSLDARLETVETSVKVAEQSQRSNRCEDMKLMETLQLKMNEELDRKIRDLRVAFECAIEQRFSRDMQNGNVEEYLEHLDGLIQSLRDVMLRKTSRFSRARQMTPGSGLVCEERVVALTEEAREIATGRDFLVREERDRLLREEARVLASGRDLVTSLSMGASM